MSRGVTQLSAEHSTQHSHLPHTRPITFNKTIQTGSREYYLHPIINPPMCLMSTILTDLPEEVKPAFSQWGLLLDLWSFPSLSPPISYDYEILVEIIKRLTLRDRMVLCLLTCQRFRRGTATGRAVWQTVDFTGFSLSSDPQVRGESALSAAWAISTLAPVDSVKYVVRFCPLSRARHLTHKHSMCRRDLILDGYQVETTPLFLFCQAFSKLTSLCIVEY